MIIYNTFIQIKLIIEQQQKVCVGGACGNINVPSVTVVSKPVEMHISSSTQKDQKADSDLGQLETSVDNCRCGGVLHDNGNSKDFIAENDFDSDVTKSPQQNPIPMSIFSKELQRNDNTVKEGVYSSANSIILSVNELSKDLVEKRMLPQDDDDDDDKTNL